MIGAVNAYIDDPEIDIEGPDEARQGPGLPRRRHDHGHARASATPTRSGRGSVRVRAKAHVEPMKGGKEAIVVTELPFMVKKGGEGGLITKIADLVRDKKITGISDLRDESDRTGMRLVIELKRGGDPAQVVLNQLYKRTAMQQASASTWSRWSTACRRPSACASWSRTTSATRRRSSPGAPSTSWLAPRPAPTSSRGC